MRVRICRFIRLDDKGWSTLPARHAKAEGAAAICFIFAASISAVTPIARTTTSAIRKDSEDSEQGRPVTSPKALTPRRLGQNQRPCRLTRTACDQKRMHRAIAYVRKVVPLIRSRVTYQNFEIKKC